jgi:hypothetical protein
MTTQSVASIIRQVLAVLVSVYGVLSATVSSLHVPPAVSAILTAFGPVLLAVEHFVGDPSTGTPTTPAKPTVGPTTVVTVPPGSTGTAAVTSPAPAGPTASQVAEAQAHIDAAQALISRPGG